MTYTVQKGDTLTKIGKKLQIDWRAIAGLNKINPPYTIRIGQQLALPPQKIDVQYTQKQMRFGNKNSNIHVLTIPRNLPRNILIPPTGIPGVSVLSKMSAGYQAAINGSFFWAQRPLGPTLVNGVRHGWSIPCYYPVDLDALILYSDSYIPMQPNVISGYTAIVVDGKLGDIAQLASYLKPAHPRTLLGWNDKSVFAAVVDGRSTASVGLEAIYMGPLMRDLGCTHAVNLDGGGSSTMIYNNQVVNKPSDGKERPIVTGIGFGR